jgi:hypothetical protein
MFAGNAGERVANDAAQECNELSIFAGYAIEETVPVSDRTGRVRCNTGDLSYVIPGIARPTLALAEIDNTIRRI